MENTIWSERYNKWISLESEFHPLNEDLVKFGKNYWYNYRNDTLIHKSIVNDYIGNTKFKNKQYGPEYWIKKFHYGNDKIIQLRLIMEHLEGKINQLGLPVSFIKKD